MSRPFKLYRLQQIDSQLDWTNSRLREIELALEEDTALQSATVCAQEAEGELEQARKRAEENTHQQRIKIEQCESTLYGGRIHNPKELKDLENEVEALKRFLVILEDRQLETMMMEEEAALNHQRAAQTLEKVHQQFQLQSKELTQERDKLSKDVARIEEERRVSAISVQKDDLDLYTQLRQKRRGVAVAQVVDKACSACGSTLNATLLHVAHSPNQINLCDTCGRILYIG
jgi:predicted  nucleic acid-binding Zn-ribbon protein